MPYRRDDAGMFELSTTGVPVIDAHADFARARRAHVAGRAEPSVTFDARFRPASEVVRARWERIALAHRKGISLPPITVRRCADGYYIVDGHHRVSVALALGHRDIDAWVTDTRSLAPPALPTAA